MHCFEACKNFFCINSTVTTLNINYLKLFFSWKTQSQNNLRSFKFYILKYGEIFFNFCKYLLVVFDFMFTKTKSFFYIVFLLLSVLAFVLNKEIARFTEINKIQNLQISFKRVILVPNIIISGLEYLSYLNKNYIQFPKTKLSSIK